MAKLIVKLTGCRLDGRSVDGEYDGGDTLATARKEAASFAEHVPAGRIAIVRPSKDGERLSLVEVFRDAPRPVL